jgi:hypothetical protein
MIYAAAVELCGHVSIPLLGVLDRILARHRYCSEKFAMFSHEAVPLSSMQPRPQVPRNLPPLCLTFITG